MCHFFFMISYFRTCRSEPVTESWIELVFPLFGEQRASIWKIWHPNHLGFEKFKFEGRLAVPTVWKLSIIKMVIFPWLKQYYELFWNDIFPMMRHFVISFWMLVFKHMSSKQQKTKTKTNSNSECYVRKVT